MLQKGNKKINVRVSNGDLGELDPHSPRVQALLFDESAHFPGYTVLYNTPRTLHRAV
jgi:hypothetical protein